MVSKGDLLARVWGEVPDSVSNVVDAYVRRLRARLGAEVITGVRGEGYSAGPGSRRLAGRPGPSRAGADQAMGIALAEVAWAAFAVANLVWMVAVPDWSMLPFHFTWISLLLLYGLGYRAASRALTWWLLAPLMIGAALIFVDDRIRAVAPDDELIELPVMVVPLFAITRMTRKRSAAMAAPDNISRHNADLLERQHAFVQNASHELRTPITVALAHAELLAKAASEFSQRDAVSVCAGARRRSAS